MKFKEKYIKEMNQVQFSQSFESFLVDKLKGTAERKELSLIIKRRKIIRVLIAVISAILLLSVSTFAVTSLRSPERVTENAQKASNTIFENRWKKSKKFPYEYGNEKYTATVLGIASGTFLNSCEGFTAEEDSSYIVTAIRSSEGLTLKDGSPLIITPLIHAREPWEINRDTLGTDVKEFEKNGVLYYLFDTAFLDAFAGRTVYIAVFEGTSPSPDVFKMKEDGTITLNENYKGFGKIWELPSDMSQVNPEKAEEMLSEDVLSQLQ